MSALIGSFAASGANSDITSLSGLTGAITTPTRATFSTGTITTSQPVLDLSQTWNSGGVTFTGIKSNITSSASAGGSMLLDLQVGGSSVMNVVKDGSINCGNVFASNVLWFFNTTAQALVSPSNTNGRFLQFAANVGAGKRGVSMSSDTVFMWGSVAATNAGDATASGNIDTGIARNAAGVVEANNGIPISGTSNAGAIKALTFCPAGTAITAAGSNVGTGSKSNAGFLSATTTGTSNITVTMPFTAPTGWSMFATDITSGVQMAQTSTNAVAVNISGVTTSGDVIQYIAIPY